MNQLTCHLVRCAFKLLPTNQSRAWMLRKCGASIGENCRIHTIEFLNLERGFDRLRIDRDCYLGPGVLIDLAGTIEIQNGAVISAKAILLSHQDAGASHNSPLASIYPSTIQKTSIGAFSWIGAGSIVVAGSIIGDRCVLAAGSVSLGNLESAHLYAGNPATKKKSLFE